MHMLKTIREARHSMADNEENQDNKLQELKKRRLHFSLQLTE